MEASLPGIVAGHTHRARVHRGIVAALVAAVPFAVWLDGWCAPFASVLPGVLWLDLVAVASVGWAMLQPGALRDAEAWSTPFDGQLLAVLALATAGVIEERAGGPSTGLLRQSLAAGGAFVGLTFLLRRERGSAEFAWRTLAFATVAMGVHALWSATGGLDALARTSHAVDARWAGHHGIARMLAFATLATAGRAAERNASPAWRISALIGGVGLVLHAAAGAFTLDTVSLARLDAPMDFSIACVTWLLAAAMARASWDLRKARRDEAWRWRALGLATGGLALVTVLGDGSGGEGVRALAALAGVAILGSPAEAAVAADVPAAASPAEGAPAAESPELSRAA